MGSGLRIDCICRKLHLLHQLVIASVLLLLLHILFQRFLCPFDQRLIFLGIRRHIPAALHLYIGCRICRERNTVLPDKAYITAG